MLDPDWDERGALLGTLPTTGRSRRRGRELCPAARSRRRRGRFAVADAYQRRGIGTRLLEQLAQRAASVGIERFVAEVMADNRDMLGVFEAVGFELTRELAGGEIEVEFPLAATEGFETSVAERDHVAVTASLRRSSSRTAWP